MSDITILTVGEVFGDATTKQLEIFKKRGTRAAISDWAIALGAYVSDDYYATDSKTLDNRTCWYWLKNRCADYAARAVASIGAEDWDNVGKRNRAVRPALPFSKIKNICSNVVRADDGVLEADFGLFPADKAVPRNLQLELQKLLDGGKLTKLSGTYTTDSRKYNDYDNGFLAMEHPVYEYKGVKYTRLKVNSCFNGSSVKFNNGEKYKDGDYVWFELKPVRLWIDEETDKAVFEKGVISGLQFNKENNYDGNFEKTDLGEYLEQFYKELTQFYAEVKSIDIVEKATVEQIPKKQNIIALFLRRLIENFPFLKNILGSSNNPKSLPEASNELAIIDAEPVKEIVSSTESKEESKEEISIEEINKLSDYIKEKSCLLIPTKRREILEKLSQLLDTHQSEVKDLDSEMYVKYNLTLVTYEDSMFNLWKGLNDLKLDVDMFLKVTSNVLNYGEEYVIYLRNLVNEYSAIKEPRVYNGKDFRCFAMNRLLELIDKINVEYNKITPYLRDEILELIFLTLYYVINMPWQTGTRYELSSEEAKSLNNKEIADKLITWFEVYFLENKDKLDEKLQTKYYDIKMTKSKEDKLAYIVELAKIIDSSLILEQDKDKKK